MRKFFTAATLAAVVFVGSLTPGCYGPFHATRNLWHWNGQVEGKWGQEFVFLLLNIVPAYGLFWLGDVLIFNSIQFWGGENPITLVADAPRTETDKVAALVGLDLQVTPVPLR
jgi:hypothetical protein